MKLLHDLAEAQALALAIVDTLQEPFLVLDDQLNLLAGSRCFYEVFDEEPVKSVGRSLFDLSGGQWDIPGLRRLLESRVPVGRGAPRRVRRPPPRDSDCGCGSAATSRGIAWSGCGTCWRGLG